MLSVAAGRRLRRVASERPRPAAAAVEYTHRARETLRDLFGAIARGESTAIGLRRFNQLLADASARLEIAPDAGRGGRAGFDWR